MYLRMSLAMSIEAFPPDSDGDRFSNDMRDYLMTDFRR